jgi:hypothetical protein
MVLFGLVLIVVGVALLLAGIFGSGYDSTNDLPTNELLNLNMPAEVFFLFGVAAGALIVIGLWFVKIGAQMGWRHRKEQKRLAELSEKLERVEADRRLDEDDDRDR